MAAITKADFSVAANGDIRHVTGTSTHTVLEGHRWLMDLLDDDTATGDDYIDVTNEIIPSARSTDEIITLNAPYNMDDRCIQRFFGGSITQAGGDTIYGGLRIIATFNAGTTIPVLIQDDKLLPNFWGTSLNPLATEGVTHRFLVKIRDGGSDIDGRRVRGQVREWGDTWAEFTSLMGEGEAVMSFGNTLQDDFNQTAVGTVAGYTDVVNNLEGFQQIDLGNGNGDRNYHSEWDRASRTLNGLFERAKWLAMRSGAEDTNNDTDDDFVVDNATITGAAQSFAVGSNAKIVTRVRLRLKKTGSPTGNVTVAIYSHSGTYGTSSVPNALVATSDAIDATQIDSAYREVEFVFTGDELVELTASTNYCIVIEHPNGDASNYVQVNGDIGAGSHGGNRSHNTAGWTAVAADDLWFEVYTSSKLYGSAGILYRGITHDCDYDAEGGSGVSQNEILDWTTGTGRLLALDDQGTSGTVWLQLLTGVAPVEDDVLTGGSGSVTVTAAITTRNLSPNNVFLGTFTGNLTGAYGVGVEATDLTNLDKLRDLENVVQTPPNNVDVIYNAVAVGDILFAAQTWEDAHTVSGSYSIGDTAITLNSAIDTDMPQPGRININDTEYNYISYSGSVVTLCAPGLVESLSGGEDADLFAFRTNQYTSTTNTSGQAYIEVNEAIETFDRTAGYIRIWNDVNLVWDRYQYDSYDTATKRYTLNTTAHPTGLDQGYTDNDPIFVPLLDETVTTSPETRSHIHTSDVDARLRVYDSAEPIVPFEVTYTVTTNGATVQAIRNPDA